MVRLGDLDLNTNVSDGATPIDVPVEEVIVHNEYSTFPAIINDVALIRLRNPVQFSSKFVTLSSSYRHCLCQNDFQD